MRTSNKLYIMIKTDFLKKLAVIPCIMMAIAAMSFVSCSSDDDEDDNGGGNPTSITASGLVGRSFTCSLTGDPNDEGLCGEDTKTITFTSSTSCSIHSYGYDWIWDNRYKKDNYNETKSCSYTVSGSKITLKNYPFFVFGGDFVLTYCGDYLIYNDEIFMEN